MIPQGDEPPDDWGDDEPPPEHKPQGLRIIVAAGQQGVQGPFVPVVTIVTEDYQHLCTIPLDPVQARAIAAALLEACNEHGHGPNTLH